LRWPNKVWKIIDHDIKLSNQSMSQVISINVRFPTIDMPRAFNHLKLKDTDHTSCQSLDVRSFRVLRYHGCCQIYIF
jgi:hypothetical protein